VSSLLENQVAVVTGAGSGIGRAIALTFASAGADVALLDVVPERCDEVAERVREAGRTALALPVDVTDIAQVNHAIDQVKAQFGRIDILVNNAGGSIRRLDFVDQSPADWGRAISLNLLSLCAVTSAALPVMIEGVRGGAIVNVTSIEGSRAAPGYSVYAACKAGINNFTRTLALELGAHGIRINTIAPDFTETPGLHGNKTGPVDPTKWIAFKPEMIERVRRRIPCGRIGIPEECGQAALFLASSMGAYVNGIVLPVDGGTFASSGWFRDGTGQWVLTDTAGV
jgi:NAD(P)-dependent dehydrogenase (short-subunit alcohol dehydrogenase family)